MRYQSVYPGIDLLYYGNQRQLEYDFLVSSGSDPKQIRFTIEGASQLQINPSGDLSISTPKGELVLHKPDIYQTKAGQRQSVDGRYRLDRHNRVGFDIARYDTTRPLVIDPVISYLTYLGGASTEDGNGISVASDGSVYIVGTSYDGSDDESDIAGRGGFPVSNGAYQSTNSGGYDISITKFSSDGTLVYSTLLGGSDEDLGQGIAVNSAGDAWIVGRTASTGSSTTTIPISGQLTLSESYPTGSSYWTHSAYVAELNASGTGLLFASYLSGDNAEGIALDASGNAYVAGSFYTLDQYGGCIYTSDPLVTKIKADGSAIVYTTKIGNTGRGNGTAIAVDTSGQTYVTGSVIGTGFATTGAFQTVPGSDYEQTAFVAKLNADGSLSYASYLGGTSVDQGNAIAVDSTGNAYVAGYTASTFPTTTGAFQTTMGSNGNGDAFVTKVNPTGTAIVYSTYLGGDGTEIAHGITVDSSGNAYIVGETSAGSSGEDTASGGFPVTENAIQQYNGGYLYSSQSSDISYVDAFLTVLNPSGNALVYSSYLGGDKNDIAQAVGLDASGNVWIAGTTLSCNLSVTGNAYQDYLKEWSYSDAFLAEIGEIIGASSVTALTADVNPVSSSAAVTFTATVSSVKESSTEPTGQVAFYDGTTLLATQSLNSEATATYATNGLTAGSHTIKASYLGDSNFAPSFSTLTETVNGLATTTSLTTSSSAVGVGDSVTFTATVSATATTSSVPTGTVTLYDGSTSLGSSTLDSSGVASYSTSSLESGSHTITAVYGGDRSFAASTSTSIEEAVSLHSTTTALQTSAASVGEDLSVTLAATVSASTTTEVTGTITFYDGTKVLATATLDSTATASYATTSLAVGTHSITAVYAGNSTWATSSSSAVTVTVTAATFTVSSSTSAQTISAGSAAAYTIRITPQNGTFNSAVTFAASGLPTGATASFSPSTVTPGRSVATTVMTIQTTSSTASVSRASKWFFATPALALVGLFIVPRRRRQRWLIPVFLIAVSLETIAILSGCNGGFALVSSASSATSSKSYIVTVTGTSGTEQESTTVTLTIK